MEIAETKTYFDSGKANCGKINFMNFQKLPIPSPYFPTPFSFGSCSVFCCEISGYFLVA
jgi:hypothetical protein